MEGYPSQRLPVTNSVPMKVMIATVRPSSSAPKGRLRRTYRASPAKIPALRTQGTNGMVSQKSKVAHAQARLPKKTMPEAIASRAGAIGRTLSRAY
jgi:hypothetical protein